GYMQAFVGVVRDCRALDSSLNGALRFVQEIDFVARGFRLPHQTMPRFARTSVRGSILVARNMRQAIDSALSQMLQNMVDITPRKVASDISEMDTRLGECEEEAGGDALALESLRAKFATFFAMRRMWFERLVERLEPLAAAGISRNQILATLDSTAADIRRVSAATLRGLEIIKQARESQNTSSRWASLAHASIDNETNNQPLRRRLAGISEVLATIQAKLVVCQACIDDGDNDDGGGVARESTPLNADSADWRTAEEAARLFASLKSDIDALNIHYQDSVAMLYSEGNYGDIGSGLGTAAGAEMATYEDDDLNTSLDGVHIFGYTPLGTNDLDAPEMSFEADPETSQTAGGRRAVSHG
ncbi:hypothetical protein IWW50_003671, partial [Coemansia erecta]